MAGSEIVTLRGGMSVPAPAVLLLLDLESRGFTIRRDGEDVLRVAPPAKLTGADREQIRRWKWHLLALLDYKAPVLS